MKFSLILGRGVSSGFFLCNFGLFLVKIPAVYGIFLCTIVLFEPFAGAETLDV